MLGGGPTTTSCSVYRQPEPGHRQLDQRRRLLSALKALGRLDADRSQQPVVIAFFERVRMADYQRMASDLRSAGIAAELCLSSKDFRQQLRACAPEVPPEPAGGRPSLSQPDSLAAIFPRAA